MKILQKLFGVQVKELNTSSIVKQLDIVFDDLRKLSSSIYELEVQLVAIKQQVKDDTVKIEINIDKEIERLNKIKTNLIEGGYDENV